MVRIALAQLNPRVGDIEASLKAILSAHKKAEAAGARLLVTSELALTGYPPLDLLDRPDLPARSEAAVEILCRETKHSKTALAVGTVTKNPAREGKRLQNSLLVLEGGKVAHSQAKSLLPTYDIFDEARYFEPGGVAPLWSEHRIGFLICEDAWAGNATVEREGYRRRPVEEATSAGAKLMISVSASPYEWGKQELRLKVHQEVARKAGAPVLSVNQCGGNDSILFDGRSFGMSMEGECLGTLPLFEEGFALWDWNPDTGALVAKEGVMAEDASPSSEIECVAWGLIRGIKDYFAKTGFDSAVIGLSGGIDSAVIASLAVQALGREKVLGVAMPGPHSSVHSLEDAEDLARRLKIPFESRPIKFSFSQLARELGERRGGLKQLTQENLQARLRGLCLMTTANDLGSLVLCTTNKSEIAVGYGTVYGDLIGALAPIGDLYKTRVYALAATMNEVFDEVIPKRSIEKAPSAELKPGQVDQDSLPPYPILDAFLEDVFENARTVRDLESRHSSKLPKPHTVSSLLQRIEASEYKRTQSPPVLRVTRKAFGIGRRMPLAKLGF